MLELAKFAQHHIPEEHELDDEDFTDRPICTVCQLGASSALVALSETESLNMRERIARVMYAFCKHPELLGHVGQQGSSRAPIPMALEGTDKDMIHAAQGPARVSITQGPTTAVPGQRSCDGVRPTARLLDTECEALKSFEALMGLGNFASQNGSPRKRVLQDANVIQYLKTYMFEDHKLTRREAVKCETNLCGSEMRVVRYEGNNNKVKYGALLCEDDQDAAVVHRGFGPK